MTEVAKRFDGIESRKMDILRAARFTRRTIMSAGSSSAARSAVASEGSTLRPFRNNVTEAELAELRRRINATKWPERETVTDPSQGVQLATIQALARYWGMEYDWRKGEAKLNALPQVITEIDGLDHRTDENHRSADRSHRTRRKCIRRLRSRDSIHARLRLFREADHDRVGTRPNCPCLDRADEAPRIHEVRGAGWRLGRNHHRAYGRASAAGIDGHPHQHGERDSTRHRQTGLFRRTGAGESLDRREARLRAAELRLCKGHRLRLSDGVETADAVRNSGLTYRSRRLLP